MRYFYHYGYYKKGIQEPENWVVTDFLIEVTEDFYDQILIPEERRILRECPKFMSCWHKPIMAETIPEGKSLKDTTKMRYSK